MYRYNMLFIYRENAYDIKLPVTSFPALYKNLRVMFYCHLRDLFYILGDLTQSLLFAKQAFYHCT